MNYVDDNELRYDVNRELDIAFGEEYESSQNILTHKSNKTIAKDERLVKLARIILGEGITFGATDIQIKLDKEYGYVRFRVGTEMLPIRRLHPASVRGLALVFKEMSQVDLDTEKIDQRGRFTFEYGGEFYDFRSGFLPTTRGEIISLRVLYSANALDDVGNLGFPDIVHKALLHVMQLKEGLILFTGATGSGKTTSMVSVINHIQRINEGRKNIFTIENPPEYDIEDATQVAVDEANDLTNERALRAVLIQNPDVIMVGEINNSQTAKTSVRASTSGHLVLATVHANDVLSTGQALGHYGVSTYDLTWALQLVLNQTLARRLCPHCRKPSMPTQVEARWIQTLGVSKDLPLIYRANPDGCDKCNHYGYFGRVMVVGMLDANTEYKKIVMKENMTLVKIEEELLGNDKAVYYPMRFDVFRQLELGNIDVMTAREIVR